MSFIGHQASWEPFRVQCACGAVHKVLPNSRGGASIMLCPHCPWLGGDPSIAEAKADHGWQKVFAQIEAEIARQNDWERMQTEPFPDPEDLHPDVEALARERDRRTQEVYEQLTKDIPQDELAELLHWYRIQHARKNFKRFGTVMKMVRKTLKRK